MMKPLRLAQRNANDIILYLSARQPIPPVPIELQQSVTSETWSSRIAAITQTVGRYSRPMFERIWMVAGFISLFVIPLVVYQVLLFAMNIRVTKDVNKLSLARGISFAAFIGVALLFYVPIFIWKFIGRQQVRRLISGWEKSDRVLGGTPLNWRVQTPGVFTDTTILRVSLPPNAPMSSFHPNAYLPNFINAPVDADASYYYPYKAEPGLPRMSVVGNVPLYLDEKRSFGDAKV